MKKVKIAEFKTHLSSHLKKVRKGEEIIILDREQPIAKVIPIEAASSGLEMIPPENRGGYSQLKKFLKPRSKRKIYRRKKDGSPIEIDIVKLLREDRDAR